jgi:hypothetical protein
MTRASAVGQTRRRPTRNSAVDAHWRRRTTAAVGHSTLSPARTPSAAHGAGQPDAVLPGRTATWRRRTCRMPLGAAPPSRRHDGLSPYEREAGAAPWRDGRGGCQPARDPARRIGWVGSQTRVGRETRKLSLRRGVRSGTNEVARATGYLRATRGRQLGWRYCQRESVRARETRAVGSDAIVGHRTRGQGERGHRSPIPRGYCCSSRWLAAHLYSHDSVAR